MLRGEEGSAQMGQMEYRLTRGFCCNCLVSTLIPVGLPSYVFLDGGLDTQLLPQPVCVIFTLYEVIFLKNILIRYSGDRYLNLLYWVGQNVHSGFSVRCYRKTQMNISANPNNYSKTI